MQHPGDVCHFEYNVRTGEECTFPEEYVRRVSLFGRDWLIDLFQVFIVADRFFFCFEVVDKLRTFLIIAVPAEIDPVHIERKNGCNHRRFVVPYFQRFFADAMVHPCILRATQEIEESFYLIFSTFFDDLRYKCLNVFRIIESDTP